MSATKKPKLLLALSELFTLLDVKDEYRHIEFAQIAEGSGFDGVFVSEHVAMGPSACSAGLPENPRQFVLPNMQDPATPWPSPLIKLAAMAGATERIRIMSCAVIAPLRHPILLAKELATLDLISRGRLTVLPTFSWQEEEYEALGIPFKERGRRLDEHLEIWDRLWQDSPASFEGEFYQFKDVYCDPKPYQGNPRIWFGGLLNEKVIARIVKHGVGMFPGFFPSNTDLAVLEEPMRHAGRSFDELEFTGWLIPDFESPDRPANIERTLEEKLPVMMQTNYDFVAIKPSCFIEQPDQLGELCDYVVKRTDELFS